MDIVPVGLFFAGACLGSFLNVVILRYVNSLNSEGLVLQNFSVGGRSQCPLCQRQLRWWELVPMLSFTFLRGRCHRCHAPLSVQYPLIELTMGVVVMILALPLPMQPSAIALVLLDILLAALVVVLFVIDLKTMLLPDIFVGILLVATLLHKVVSCQSSVVSCYADAGYGVAIGAGFLFLLWVITRGQGIGLGDVKLMIPLGLWAGVAGTITLLFIAYMAGGGLAFYLLGRKKATMKSAMPFGPFLCGAALLLVLIPTLPEHLFTLIFGYNPWG